MKLFLIRHADAVDYETDTVKEDDYRFITSKGRDITVQVAESLKDKLRDLDKIYMSPLIRAVQTAEIFATILKFGNEAEPVNELRNESTISSLQQLIKKNSALRSIALVGHEPKMGLLVKSFSDKNNLDDFRKSSVCLIDFNTKAERGKFIWYFDSKSMEFEK